MASPRDKAAMASKMDRQWIISSATLCFAALLFCVAMTAGARAQTFTMLVSFDGSNGTTPVTPLAQGRDGNL